MSTLIWSRFTDEHLARAQQAADLLAPRWTTHILQTLRESETLGQQDVLRAIPNAPIISVRAALARLADAQLLTPVREGRTVRYHLTPAGQATQPVHEAVARWIQVHSPDTGRTPPAQQVEQALRALSLAHALPVLKEIAAGPLSSPELAQRLPARPTPMAIHHQMRKIVDHGLAERRNTVPVRFLITPRAKALPAVINALAACTPHLPPDPHPSPRPAPRPSDRAPQRPAVLSYRPSDLFSHPHLPATPHPGRRRNPPGPPGSAPGTWTPGLPPPTLPPGHHRAR